MRLILTASKDTTLYQSLPTTNAGLDEILEIGNVVENNSTVLTNIVSSSARTLLSFDLPTTASVSAASTYFLNLRLANASNLRREQVILVQLISSSWDEGSGYLYQQPYNANDGATWEQASQNITWQSSGGDFLSGTPTQSVVLSAYILQDLQIDVTNLVRPFVNEARQSQFYGLGLQFPVVDENDATNSGNVKIFSTQTHTIYQPTLEIAWESQVFQTGSLLPIPSLDVKIVPVNLREIYTKGDTEKVSFVVRDRYPLKSFDSTLRYKNKYYLPQSSYFSIVDVQSNTTIIPFDEFSKVHTNTSGSFIVLDTTPLYAGRYYKIQLKVESNGYTRTLDTDIQFKVQ
jgi:hypothetical protein